MPTGRAITSFRNKTVQKSLNQLHSYQRKLGMSSVTGCSWLPPVGLLELPASTPMIGLRSTSTPTILLLLMLQFRVYLIRKPSSIHDHIIEFSSLWYTRLQCDIFPLSLISTSTISMLHIPSGIRPIRKTFRTFSSLLEFLPVKSRKKPRHFDVTSKQSFD